MGYHIIVRDRQLRKIGEIDTWTKLDFVVAFNEQGSWQLLVKSGTPQANLLDKAGGIAIYQDGVTKPILTGQIESFQKYWTVEQHTGPGSTYVGGKTDNKLAYSRLAFPDPNLPVGNQYTGPDNRTVSDSVGDVIWNEFAKSLGPSALVDRQIAGLNMGTAPQGLGNVINDTLRYDSIGAKIEEWCTSQDIGYQFLWNPDTQTIDFSVFEPSDKSQDIRFAPELGNLREYTWTLSAPKVTRVIVACQGEGSERYIYQKVDADAEAEWGVSMETFVDRRDLPLKTGSNGAPVKANADVTDEQYDSAVLAVEEAADAALKEGEKQGNFQIYPIDTPQVRFGRDYFVGDKVTVITDGTEYSDIVRQVTITVDEGGKTESVSPVIGQQGSGQPLNLYKTVFEQREKLRKLERRM